MLRWVCFQGFTPEIIGILTLRRNEVLVETFGGILFCYTAIKARD